MDAKNKEGLTAIDFAGKSGHEHVVHLLKTYFE
jgi:hypothetical protein